MTEIKYGEVTTKSGLLFKRFLSESTPPWNDAGYVIRESNQTCDAKITMDYKFSLHSEVTMKKYFKRHVAQHSAGYFAETNDPKEALHIATAEMKKDHAEYEQDGAEIFKKYAKHPQNEFLYENPVHRSAYRRTCGNCHGEKIMCGTCNHSGKLDCTRCNSWGYLNCGCGGNPIRCKRCSGYGKLNCSCGGQYIPCNGCGGRGYFQNMGMDHPANCSSCGGSGKQICPHCYRGEFNCGDCSGRGSFTCSTCGGGGTITCDECQGKKNVNCHDCQGTGDRWCNTCGNERTWLEVYVATHTAKLETKSLGDIDYIDGDTSRYNSIFRDRFRALFADNEDVMAIKLDGSGEIVKYQHYVKYIRLKPDDINATIEGKGLNLKVSYLWPISHYVFYTESMFEPSDSVQVYSVDDVFISDHDTSSIPILAGIKPLSDCALELGSRTPQELLSWPNLINILKNKDEGLVLLPSLTTLNNYIFPYDGVIYAVLSVIKSHKDEPDQIKLLKILHEDAGVKWRSSEIGIAGVLETKSFNKAFPTKEEFAAGTAKFSLAQNNILQEVQNSPYKAYDKIYDKTQSRFKAFIPAFGIILAGLSLTPLPSVDIFVVLAISILYLAFEMVRISSALLGHLKLVDKFTKGFVKPHHLAKIRPFLHAVFEAKYLGLLQERIKISTKAHIILLAMFSTIAFFVYNGDGMQPYPRAYFLESYSFHAWEWLFKTKDTVLEYIANVNFTAIYDDGLELIRQWATDTLAFVEKVWHKITG